MHVVFGDLLALAAAGEFDILVHGCNCRRTMGAGIAKQIKARFPAAFEADRRTTEGPAKLGTFSHAVVEIGSHRLTIVNACTQDHWRGPGVKVDYDAVRLAMRAVKSLYQGRRIGYPRIGAGLAGGDWERLRVNLDEELEGETHTLVEYSP